MYTQKIAMAIMALDHSRLGLENKFLENKSGRIFSRSTSLLYKILLTSLGTCKPTFYTFIHHIWGETGPWGCVFIIKTSDRMPYFTILHYKLHIQYLGRSKHTLASHAGVFRGARISSLPTNACSTEDNIPFPLLHSRGKWPINGF